VPPGTADAVPTRVREVAAETVARRARRQPVDHAQKAERRYAADVADGRVPSLRALVRDLGLGQPKAREVRAYLASLVTANGR
jgi:hypothetical protein